VGSLLAAYLVFIAAAAKPYKAAAPVIYPESVEHFFRNSVNFVDVPLDRIFEQVGRPLTYDDWDWGRYVYDWRTEHCRIRAITRGGFVIAVLVLDPDDSSPFATERETIWEKDA
jgi:hypothetical protein